MKRWLACLLAVCAAAACGGGDEMPPWRPVSDDGGVIARFPAVNWPTATFWPTFTPQPTPTATLAVRPAVPTAAPTVLLPTASPTPTPTWIAPTATPALSGTRAPAPTMVPTATAHPTPTRYGQLAGGPAHLSRHTVLAFRNLSAAEAYFGSGDVTRWASPDGRFSRNARYLVWAVAFDVTEAADDFLVEGTARWLDLDRALDNKVIYQENFVVSKEQPGFFSGLGEDVPGFWRPGRYRVEWWDDRDVAVIGWDFEVY